MCSNHLYPFRYLHWQNLCLLKCIQIFLNIVYFSQPCLFIVSVFSFFLFLPVERLGLVATEELVNMPSYVHTSTNFMFLRTWKVV